MDVHKLAELDLLELKDNWVEKSKTTLLEGENYRKEERFKDITQIDDVIEIGRIDIWEEKIVKKKEWKNRMMRRWKNQRIKG